MYPSRFLRRFVVSGLWLIVLLGVSLLTSAQDDTDALENIDRALTNLVDRRDFSGSVLIGRGDEVLFKKGYGLAVIEWAIPNAPDTVFRIGSITKQFTGIAILKLQEDGKLNIDDPICDYLDECPKTWSEIPIYHLLTHTSGIPSYTELETMPDLALSDVPPDGVIETFIDLPLDFEPGSEWYYNNSGYHLLGDIVANASGISYQRYLQDNFFDPLDMDSTDLESNTRVIPRRAEGYSSANIRAEYINMNVPYSAGAIISTVEDLFMWQRALFTGQIVPQETLDAMWERAFPIEGPLSYGYGLVYDTSKEQVAIWHSGGINGFSTQMSYLPALDLSIIVLTNRESGVIEDAMSVITDAMTEDS